LRSGIFLPFFLINTVLDQVQNGVDHLSPPLLDLDNICMIFSLSQDSIARKEEPVKLLNKTKQVCHPLIRKETILVNSNKNQSKDANNFNDSSSRTETPAEVLIEKEVAEIQKTVDKTAKNSQTSCKLCGESRLNSKFSLYLHKHLKHNQFLCLICDSLFKNVTQLADHLKIVHKIKEKKSNHNQRSELTPDVQSVFVCTECSAVVHGFDLESHSYNCNAKPLFPLQGLYVVLKTFNYH
jgi:hypothetical protein